MKPTMSPLEACHRLKTNTEKQRTEVSRRTKIVIGISAFILIFSLIVAVIMWFEAAQGFIPVTPSPGNVTLNPGNVEATLLSLI